MTRHARLSLRLDGPILVGGYSAPTGYLDATSAVDANGTPFIPASALKGALREACTRLARGEDLGRACTLADEVSCGGTCVVCRLFGAPGTETDDVLRGGEIVPGVTGRLQISDAVPADPHAAGALRESIAARHGVAIDRAQRSASPDLLYQREVVGAPGNTFVADVIARNVDDSTWHLFKASTRLVTGIGNSRTRGLGHLAIDFAEIPNPAPTRRHAFPDRVPDEGLALVHIEALEPLVLGGLPPTSNLIESLDYVPGSTLRGALANAAAVRGTGATFQRVFVDPATCLRFSDAFATSDASHLPIITPLSSLRCKHADRHDHKRRPDYLEVTRPLDGLLALALLPTALRGGGQAHTRPCRVPDCKTPLQGAKGLWPPVEVTRRVVTRLARDPWTSSAMPGMLYSVAQIEAGTKFTGTVARLDAEALVLLAPLTDVELRLGRGRTRGQGKVRITIAPASTAVELGARSVNKRVSDFNQQIVAPLRQQFESAWAPRPFGGAVAVLARTDLDLPPESAEREIAQRLFGAHDGQSECLARYQATGSRSGWDEGQAAGPAGQRPLTPVVRAGSAWLFVHEPGVTPDVAGLERDGVGKGKELGFGWVAVDHRLFFH